MSRRRVAIVQFPGVNCEAETARALARAGLEARIHRWTHPPDDLRDDDAFVLPGGFSYQDRVRAGALAAKDPMLEVLAEEAGRGKPVLGICNGAQVLVEAGLVPGGSGVEVALARNAMRGRSGYYARWIHVRIEASPCVFTRHLAAGTVLALPVAHGEGRFTAPRGRIRRMVGAGLAPLRYATAAGEPAGEFPDNPNGSEEAVAALCNERGNVMAMMPHPERALDSAAVPRSLADAERLARGRGGDDARVATLALDAPGPGMALFDGLRLHLEGA